MNASAPRQGLAQIATALRVCDATIRVDLRSLESDFAAVAQLTHDDMLLEQIHQLHQRLAALRSNIPTDLLERIGLPAYYRISIQHLTRLHAFHQRALNAANREPRPDTATRLPP